MEQLIRYSLLSQELTDEEYQIFVCNLMQKLGRNEMNSFIFKQFNPDPTHAKPIQANIHKQIESTVRSSEFYHSESRKSQISLLTNTFNNIITDIFNERRQCGNNDTFSIDSCIDIINKIIEERDADSSFNYDNNLDSFPKECIGKIASFLDCTSYSNLQCSSRNLFLSTNSPVTLESICISSTQQANAFKIYKYPNVSNVLVNLRFFKQIIDTNIRADSSILCNVKKLALCSDFQSAFESDDGIEDFYSTDKIFDLTELHTLSLNGIPPRYVDYLLKKIISMTKHLQYLYIERPYERDYNYGGYYYSNRILFPSLKGLSLHNRLDDNMFARCIPVYANQIESLRMDDGTPPKYAFQSVRFGNLKELSVKLSSNTKQNQINGITQATTNLEKLRIDFGIDFSNRNNKIYEILTDFIKGNQSLNQVYAHLYNDYNQLHKVMPTMKKILSCEEITQCDILNISVTTTISGVIPTAQMFDTFTDVINTISIPIPNVMITLVLRSVHRYSKNVKYIKNELESRISNGNWNILVSAKHFSHTIVIRNKNYKIKDLNQMWCMSENDISYHNSKSTKCF